MKRDDYRRILPCGPRQHQIYDITLLERDGIATISRLPYCIRLLAENLLRHCDGQAVKEGELRQLLHWQPRAGQPVEIPFHPARVLMQDFTGVPALVDLAAMRDAIRALGGDPGKINPRIPVDLVIDHSLQVDFAGSPSARQANLNLEYERNRERYTFLKWAQKSFAHLRIVPPNSGICHQVNLEFLAQVVTGSSPATATLAYPDTLIGTDSHTTMINGLGVLGWGVGGIEAEAVILGEPYFLTIPEVVGVKLLGDLPAGATATDLVLRITELLRAHGVVDKFVEFFGPGLQALTVPDRATIANMAPEYGATTGFFPVDEQTIAYLLQTNRGAAAALTQKYCQETGLWHDQRREPEYSEVIVLELSAIEPAVAGPARPQERIPLSGLKGSFRPQSSTRPEPALQEGSIVIAALTSCTNTSNPSVLIGAGLLAREAVRRGLRVPAHVKTSFAPGSQVVSQYLEEAGLMAGLEALGFHLVGYGCTTCIGNSGPLAPEIEEEIVRGKLTVAAVLSGNRNFEARIHQRVKANFLASPPLVIAFALAGRITIDLTREPLGYDPQGRGVMLAELWPSGGEIEAIRRQYLRPELFQKVYAGIFAGDHLWQQLPTRGETNYHWDPHSEYIKRPPYFDNFSPQPLPPEKLQGARALLLLGHSVTTDHISPAGAIPAHYPAGEYLRKRGIPAEDFNSYGTRRGNHEVMIRGTFANIRIKNQLVAPQEGGLSRKFPAGELDYIFNVAQAYRAEGVPLLILGGREYGTGSSRDWAAKGTALLGIKAVVAESYERIHRANLAGMGVLPLQFQAGESWQSLGLDGSERFSLNTPAVMAPQQKLEITATREDGRQLVFTTISRLTSEIEVDYFTNGGILEYVLRKFLSSSP